MIPDALPIQTPRASHGPRPAPYGPGNECISTRDNSRAELINPHTCPNGSTVEPRVVFESPTPGMIRIPRAVVVDRPGRGHHFFIFPVSRVAKRTRTSTPTAAER